MLSHHWCYYFTKCVFCLACFGVTSWLNKLEPLLIMINYTGWGGQEGGRKAEIWSFQEGRAEGEEESKRQGWQQTKGLCTQSCRRKDHRGNQWPWRAFLPHQVEGWEWKKIKQFHFLDHRLWWGWPGTSQRGQCEDSSNRDQILRGKAQLVCNFTISPLSLYSNSYPRIGYTLVPKTFLTTFDLAGTTPRMGTTKKRNKNRWSWV